MVSVLNLAPETVALALSCAVAVGFAALCIASNLTIRRIGGIWFIRCGRLGGSFYLAKVQS